MFLSTVGAQEVGVACGGVLGGERTVAFKPGWRASRFALWLYPGVWKKSIMSAGLSPLGGEEQTQISP